MNFIVANTLIFCLFINQYSFGQTSNDDIYVREQKSNWEQFVKSVEKENAIRFFYQPEGFPVSEVVVKQDSILLIDLLQELFSKHEIEVSTDYRGNYFLFENFKLRTQVENSFGNVNLNASFPYGDTITPSNASGENDYLKTYQDFISETITIGEKGQTANNGKVKVTGIVTNADDKSPIPQARLFVAELNSYFTTNSSGYYEIDILPGTYTLTVNSLGMYKKSLKLNVLSYGTLNIPLEVKAFLLDETVVLADRKQNVRSPVMGFERITEKTIKELPVVLGEKDIVKIVLLLPGVQTIGEISSGFNVRGSPSDQNMFYINDLPVYNSSHLFGLFTTFNSDAISEFKFYKNSIPVEYGGQLSSIFDIDVKRGNQKNLTVRGGIGLTSGRVLVEGPLKKDLSSFLVSVRSTYSDWLLKQVDNLDVKSSSASFQDALVDFSLQLDESNNLQLFFYGSHDFADLAFGIRNEYSNLGANIKWSHIFGEKLKSEANIAMSNYNYEEANFDIIYLANQHSFNLNHTEAKFNLDYLAGSGHNFQLGINSKFIKLIYGDFLPLDNQSSVKPIQFEPEQALNNSVYLGDRWDISPAFTIEGGIRATLYSYLGPKTVFSYDENAPLETQNITDTVRFERNEFIKNHTNLDFRTSVKYELTSDLSVKASYNRLHQYIFMLSNTVTVSPISKWKLSDTHLKPMSGNQFSTGIYKNFSNDNIEVSAEIYYKDVKNLVEYKDGAEFITNKIPETNIIQGNMESYGLELMLKKKAGKLNGWVNYTYSKAEVTALNRTTGEMNNQGLAYPANWDRPHAANMTLNFKATKRLGFSANVVYSTGRPVTFPASVYYLNDMEITGFSKRNAFRLPDYFRTDFSVNLEGNLKKNKLAHGSWSLSFYNLTGRKNPYAMVFQNVDGEIKGYKISILGTVIPSLNYNLKFGNYED